MATTPAPDLLTLLAEVKQRVIEDVLSKLDLFDDPQERLAAVDACIKLSYERDRDRLTASKPLGGDTLIGSYFRAPDQQDPEAESSWLDGESCKTIEGMVVGQPFTSTSDALYLVEFYGEHGATGFQQLVELSRMTAQRWAFYDTDSWLSQSRSTTDIPEREEA